MTLKVDLSEILSCDIKPIPDSDCIVDLLIGLLSTWLAGCLVESNAFWGAKKASAQCSGPVYTDLDIFYKWIYFVSVYFFFFI